MILLFCCSLSGRGLAAQFLMPHSNRPVGSERPQNTSLGNSDRKSISMRDIAALLTSLVNIDRHSLIAILTSQAEAAQRSREAAKQRTAAQRAKRLQTVNHLARIDRLLCF